MEKKEVNLNDCKPGDKLLTKHGTILEYVCKLNPEIDYYDHRIKYPDGSFGTRVNSGHVMKNINTRLETDEDIIKIMNTKDRAKELVDYYNDLLQSEMNCIVYLQTAKKCATECVNRILNSNSNLLYQETVYWERVLKEIELL